MTFATGLNAMHADVVFETNTGVFNAEMVEILSSAERTYGGISDLSLRAAVAQERYGRVLEKTSAESYAAGRATVAYRNELAAIAAESARVAAAEDRVAAARRRTQLAAAQTVGRTLTTYVAAPAALIAGYSAKLAIDFSQQMLLIQTQAGATAGEVHKLTGELLKLAGSPAPTSPQELAQGLYHLESVGLRGAKALDTLKISSIAAGEGIADLESVTTALGGVVVTGIKGAEDYQKALDTLVATVGVGNVRFADLAGAVGNVTPAAAAAGVTLPELGAALAVLTDRGFSADEAATKLRMTFSLIQSPSEKAKKALADMGIEADSLGSILRSPNGLLKVLEILQQGIERVGANRGNRDLLKAFGGGRSGLGIQTLVGSLNSELSSYQGKLADISKQEQQASVNRQAYLASDAYKLHAAVASVQADMIKLGQGLAPAIVGAGKVIATLADAFDHLPHDAKVELGVIVGVLAVGGPLLLAILGTVKAVDSIGNAFTTIPVKAAPAIAATEAELATLAATAETTGAAAGTGIATGVGAGVATAEARVAALRLSLIGLGALVIAPIVIPIETKFLNWAGKGLSGLPGGSNPNQGNRPPSDFNDPSTWSDDEKAAYAAQHGPKTADYYRHHPAEEMRVIKAGLASEKAPPVETKGPGTAHTWHPPAPQTPQQAGELEKVQSAVSSAQLAVARGDRGAKQALVRALKEEIDYDRKYEAIQEDLIRRGVGDRKQHAKILAQLQSDEQGALGQISSINQAAATSAKQAADEAARRRKKAADDVKQARDARVQQLTEIPIDLRIAEVKAEARGASESKLVAIYKREKKALEEQLAELIKMHASKEAILQVWQNIDSVDQKIRGATGKKTDSLAANEREFLDAVDTLIASNAPNFSTRESEPRTPVVVHNHYPSSPTDHQRDARLARLAYQQAGMDV